MPDKKLTPNEVRARLKQLAKQQGLDPALAESALDPDKEIPAELMDVLTLVAGRLSELDED